MEEKEGKRKKNQDMMMRLLEMERRGEHKAVDLVLAAVVGDFRRHLEPEEIRRQWQDAPKGMALVPGQEVPRYLVNVPGDETSIPFIGFNRGDAPLDLDISKRLQQVQTLESAPMPEGKPIVPKMEPVEPALLTKGFITPDGTCYQFMSGQNTHDSLARLILMEHDQMYNPYYDPKMEDVAQWLWKATLQKRGWVAFIYGRVNVLRDGETHSPAFLRDLTLAQQKTIRELYNSGNEVKKIELEESNPKLKALFE